MDRERAYETAVCLATDTAHRIQLQRISRGYLARVRYVALKRSQRVIQSVLAGCLQRRRLRKMAVAAGKIQEVYRKHRKHLPALFAKLWSEQQAPDAIEIEMKRMKLRLEAFEDEASCPITLQEIKQPVLCLQDAKTYEKSAISEWMIKRGTSPVTRAPLVSDDLVDATPKGYKFLGTRLKQGNALLTEHASLVGDMSVQFSYRRFSLPKIYRLQKGRIVNDRPVYRRSDKLIFYANGFWVGCLHKRMYFIQVCSVKNNFPQRIDASESELKIAEMAIYSLQSLSGWFVRDNAFTPDKISADWVVSLSML